MGVFRRLGRQVELFSQIARQTANGPTIARCEACRAWIPTGGKYCLYCGHQPPHTVLGVPANAPAEIVKAAAREKLKSAHPDHGGSQFEFQRVKNARDELIEKHHS